MIGATGNMPRIAAVAVSRIGRKGGRGLDDGIRGLRLFAFSVSIWSIGITVAASKQ